MSEMSIENAKQEPKFYYARHMQPGLCGYDEETILVDIEAIKRLIPTFSGKPVFILHQKVDHDNLKQQANGYIVDSFYNNVDGWAWVKFMLIDDEAHDVVGKGWAVSNAYVPSQWGPKGLKNNCPYDRELIDGKFTHMGLVPDPRYEDAEILSPEQFSQYQSVQQERLNELRNSKGAKMKLFKNKREEVTEIDDEAMIEFTNAKGEIEEISLKDMKESVLNAKAKKNSDKAEKMNADTMVTVGEEKMKLGDLVAYYGEMCNKRNAEDESDKDFDEDEKDEKKAKKNKKSEKKNAGEDDEDDKENAQGKKEDDDEGEDSSEKKNGRKHFDELRNANSRFNPSKVQVQTISDQLKRGSERY